MQVFKSNPECNQAEIAGNKSESLSCNIKQLPHTGHEQTVQSERNKAAHIRAVVNPPCGEQIPDKHAPIEMPENFTSCFFYIVLYIVVTDIKQRNKGNK